MKLILTSFGHMLISKVLDWPEPVGDTIEMVLNSGTFKRRREDGTIEYTLPAKNHLCVFEWVGKCVERDGHQVRVYQLIDIK